MIKYEKKEIKELEEVKTSNIKVIEKQEQQKLKSKMRWPIIKNIILTIKKIIQRKR